MKPRLLIILYIALNCSVFGQFNSGSTGADGALDLGVSCPGTVSTTYPYVCVLQMPESGVFNFTSVNIPQDKHLLFRANSRNTAVHLLAQGTVTITGVIDIRSPCLNELTGIDPTACQNYPRQAGPGGFPGGSLSAGHPNGFGPGGGIYSPENTDYRGRWVGPLSLVPLVGGSGNAYHSGGFPGLGGNGAILIAASSVVMNGYIYAGSGTPWIGSSGAGGAIRLVANTLSVGGTLIACPSFQISEYCGVIRLEANELTYTGQSVPLAISSPINHTVLPSSIARLTITQVGGAAVPSYAGSRTDLIDVLLSNSISDPIPVLVSAQNIPTGTQVQIGFMTGSQNATSTPCNLAGTFENSSCTATISNLNRSGGTYLIATAAFDPPPGVARFNPRGRNHVVKVVLESPYGGTPRYRFLRKNGTEVAAKDLPKNFLIEFGI